MSHSSPRFKMNLFYSILFCIIFTGLMSGCAYKNIQVKTTPISYVGKINLEKESLMRHIRLTASNYFLSAKAVIDNYDSKAGIIQIKYVINMETIWGYISMNSDKNIDIQLI